MKTSVFFSKQIPSIKKIFDAAGPQIKQALVLCDQKLKYSPIIKPWKKNKSIKFYYLKSGEKSKSLERLPFHINKILFLNKNFDKNSLMFISLGGGSLSDLTGFIASIYKRGLPLVHLPGTWLCALDSAHGGKTAINFKNIKNLLGSYHFPKAVFIVKSLLNQNPDKLKKEAYGELLKIALIEGGGLYKKLLKEGRKNISMESFLKPAIQAKMKIVRRDPWEKKHIRKKLNLGHTIGHILEAEQGLPHGAAVLQGLCFSLNWSFKKRFIERNHFEQIKKLIPLTKKNKKITSKNFMRYLRQDKKHKKNSALDFIFIKSPGKVFSQSVSEKEILKEAQRQSLIYGKK